MALPNFTDQKIQETYQRVLQTDGENIYDGTGSALPLKIDGPDLIVSGAVRAQSYIVSESLTVVTSGSTVFGDTLDDTHLFTGSLNVSGSVSAAGGYKFTVVNFNYLNEMTSDGNVGFPSELDTYGGTEEIAEHVTGNTLTITPTTEDALFPAGTESLTTTIIIEGMTTGARKTLQLIVYKS